MPTKCCWWSTAVWPANTKLPLPHRRSSITRPAAQSSAQAPSSLSLHALRSSSARQAQTVRVRTRRRVGSTRRRGNHMHDHSRFQRDINDVTGVSLSLSLSQKSLTHNIGSASALPIIMRKPELAQVEIKAKVFAALHDPTWSKTRWVRDWSSSEANSFLFLLVWITSHCHIAGVCDSLSHTSVTISLLPNNRMPSRPLLLKLQSTRFPELDLYVGICGLGFYASVLCEVQFLIKPRPRYVIRLYFSHPINHSSHADEKKLSFTCS